MAWLCSDAKRAAERVVLCHTDYFELQAPEKQHVQGEDFSEVPSPARSAFLQEELPLREGFPRSSTSQGGLTLLVAEAPRGPGSPGGAPSQTTTPPIGSPKGPLIFPKNDFLSRKCPHRTPPSLLNGI